MNLLKLNICILMEMLNLTAKQATDALKISEKEKKISCINLGITYF